MIDLPPASLRRDPVSGRWVAVAPQRRGTPVDAVHGTRVTGDRSTCPFCPGHEHLTGATRSVRVDAHGHWTVRAVANRFPTMMPDAADPWPVPGGVARPSEGDHEVLVETPDHDADLATLPDSLSATVVDLYRERFHVMARHRGARAVLLFKNRGPRAGASLVHPHAQVLALPLVPPAIQQRDVLAARAYRETGMGTVAGARDRELAAGLRVISRTHGFVVFCPFASHRRFETWIVPVRASPALGLIPDEDVAPLGCVLTDTLRRLREATGDADYNLVVRSPARKHWGQPWALWHLEILPRMAGEAGFELSTGMYCTSGLPEESAARLRNCG